MIHATRDERQWFLRNMAHGLVDYLGAIYPPIWVENLLKAPPPIYAGLFNHVLGSGWDVVFRLPNLATGSASRPWELPIDERRYAIARELLVAMGGSDHGRAMGMPELFVSHLEDCQDYFARVLLAPDPLVTSYRKQGRDIRGFAETFLIPLRVADRRWQDPIFE